MIELIASSDIAIKQCAITHVHCHCNSLILLRYCVVVTFPACDHPPALLLPARSSMPKLTVLERKQIAQLYQKNWSISYIAKRFNCCNKTAAYWAERGSNPSETFKDVGRSGRPGKLQGVVKYKARRMARGGSTAGQIASTLSKCTQQTVGAAAVIRSLKSSSDPLLWVPVNRGRVLSATNRKKRKGFSRANKGKQTGAWVYGDSKFYYMYKDGAGKLRWGWRNLQDQKMVLKAGNPYVLHFYAFVSKGFKSKLYFVAPTAAAGSKARKGREAYASKHFIQLLHKVKRDLQHAGKCDARHPLVLDRARQHTSKASKAAIQQLELHLVDDFPPQSWDINVIENVWGVLDGKLAAMSKNVPRTPDGWRKRVKRAWDQVEQSTINKLIDAVPQRMAHIEQLDGAWLYAKKSKH
jgi:transposase